MSSKKLERTIRRQLTTAMEKSIAHSRQFLVCYVLEDGSMASAIMMADGLTAEGVENIEYGITQRHQKSAIIFNIIELEPPGGAQQVALPTAIRRILQQFATDSGDAALAAWLEEIGHPVKAKE